jgi:hypothetical protein
MKSTPLRRKSGRLHARAENETNQVKDRIQALVRNIVIARDKGCIFRDAPFAITEGSGPPCNGYANDGHLILQADHLITRANSATYADTRLIVCVCKGHHGWKKWNEARYNEIVRTLIGEERCKLWDACHAARYKPTRNYTSDWLKHEAALKQELREVQAAAL